MTRDPPEPPDDDADDPAAPWRDSPRYPVRGGARGNARRSSPESALREADLDGAFATTVETESGRVALVYCLECGQRHLPLAQDRSACPASGAAWLSPADSAATTSRFRGPSLEAVVIIALAAVCVRLADVVLYRFMTAPMNARLASGRPLSAEESFQFESLEPTMVNRALLALGVIAPFALTLAWHRYRDFRLGPVTPPARLLSVPSVALSITSAVSMAAMFDIIIHGLTDLSPLLIGKLVSNFAAAAWWTAFLSFFFGGWDLLTLWWRTFFANAAPISGTTTASTAGVDPKAVDHPLPLLIAALVTVASFIPGLERGAVPLAILVVPALPEIAARIEKRRRQGATTGVSDWVAGLSLTWVNLCLGVIGGGAGIMASGLLLGPVGLSGNIREVALSAAFSAVVGTRLALAMVRFRENERDA
jgi:hypothetical protein